MKFTRHEQNEEAQYQQPKTGYVGHYLQRMLSTGDPKIQIGLGCVCLIMLPIIIIPALIYGIFKGIYNLIVQVRS